MLGRIVPIEKGSNEAASTSAIFACRSSCFTIWFNPNAIEKTDAEGVEFFSGPRNGACAARRLVSAVVMQGGKIGRGHFHTEVFAHRLVPRQRAYDSRGSPGEAEGISES